MIDARSRLPASACRETTTERFRRHARLARHADAHEIAALGLGGDDGDRAAGVSLGEVVRESAARATCPGLVGEDEHDGAGCLLRGLETCRELHVLLVAVVEAAERRRAPG